MAAMQILLRFIMYCKKREAQEPGAAKSAGSRKCGTLPPTKTAQMRRSKWTSVWCSECLLLRGCMPNIVLCSLVHPLLCSQSKRQEGFGVRLKGWGQNAGSLYALIVLLCSFCKGQCYSMLTCTPDNCFALCISSPGTFANSRDQRILR